MAETTNITGIANPFLGGRPFLKEDENRFFGRDTEVSQLLTMITGADRQLTVMFGAPGVGLTSLVHAKLLPSLERLYYQPVHIRFFTGQEDPLLTTRKLLVQELRKWEPNLPDFKTGQSLTDYAAGTSLLKGLIKPVLFFDNFDELFGKGYEKDRNSINGFLVELGDLIELRLPDNVRSIETLGNASRFTVVLCMRQEWLPYLDDYASRIPSLLQNRFRLREFNTRQASEAITRMGIIDKTPIITETAVQRIIQQLAQPDPNDSEVEINPGELSIYCYELFEQAKKQAPSIIGEELVENCRFSRLLQDYYERSVEHDQPIAVLIENRLITLKGLRLRLPLDTLIAGSGVTPDQIRDFARRTGILRVINHNIIPDVEITHDSLAAQIASSRPLPIVAVSPPPPPPSPPRARRRIFLPTLAAIVVVTVGIYFVQVFSHYSTTGPASPIVGGSGDAIVAADTTAALPTQATPDLAKLQDSLHAMASAHKKLFAMHQDSVKKLHVIRDSFAATKTQLANFESAYEKFYGNVGARLQPSEAFISKYYSNEARMSGEWDPSSFYAFQTRTKLNDAEIDLLLDSIAKQRATIARLDSLLKLHH